MFKLENAKKKQGSESLYVDQPVMRFAKREEFKRVVECKC